MEKIVSFVSRGFSYLYYQSWKRGLWTTPDRKILRDTILRYYAIHPDFKRILFVGVRDYTRAYNELFARKDFVTIDPDPAMKDFGAEYHICDRLENLRDHCAPQYFDVIILNGVIGYGLDRPKDIEDAVSMSWVHLKRGGHLVIGQNPGKPENFELKDSRALRLNFEPFVFEPLQASELTVKLPFQRVRHSYHFYETL